LGGKGGGGGGQTAETSKSEDDETGGTEKKKIEAPESKIRGGAIEFAQNRMLPFGHRPLTEKAKKGTWRGNIRSQAGLAKYETPA